MIALEVQHAAAATQAEVAPLLSRAFPAAGSYLLKGPHGIRAVDLSAPAALAADPLTLWQALFPVDGAYLVKAAGPTGTRAFDIWFYERLLTEARRNGGRIRDWVHHVIEAFIREHGGTLAQPELLERFERLLFDLRQGVRWSVALRVDAEVERRLRGLGLTEHDVVDVAGIAYRLGRLERTLRTAGRGWSWATALAEAAAAPLLPADMAAIAYAQSRAARYLTPVLTREGQALHEAALAHEVSRLRTLTAEAVRAEMHPREFARQLYHVFEPEGVWRDWERVARTEIHEARTRGAWSADREARGWTADTLVYRMLGTNPCNGCLLLYRLPNGHPRLYRVGDVEAADAQGPNRGPWREWHVRIGPTHPNCRDSPWGQYGPALEAVFRREATQWAAEYARRKLNQSSDEP